MKNYSFTSESVCEGHPDKVCDAVADAILDALLAQDPATRCACEVTAEPGAMHIMGEITTRAKIDYIETAREVIRRIGYTKDEYGFTDRCRITCSLHSQSPDIAQGVDSAFDRSGDIGAGDQGIMFGYATDESPNLMPLPIEFAHALTARLTEVRKSGELPYLRPDGKSQVTVEYRDGKPSFVSAVVVSAQHDPEISMETLREDIVSRVIKPVIPASFLSPETRYFINPTGRFVLGGPAGDTGLTGRKLIVDTYGGAAHHGGGAFSGKDATKVDRTASYMARFIAKHVVASGLASRCELQLGYAIGVAEPVSLYADTFGTGTISDEELAMRIRKTFDMRPAAMIARLGLREPVFSPTVPNGAFGHPEFAWEKTDPSVISSLKL